MLYKPPFALTCQNCKSSSLKLIFQNNLPTNLYDLRNKSLRKISLHNFAYKTIALWNLHFSSLKEHQPVFCVIMVNDLANRTGVIRYYSDPNLVEYLYV